MEEMFGKLKEISLCYDTVSRFGVFDPVVGKTLDRSCAWFAREAQRCQSYQEGRFYCRLTCGSPKDRSWCGPISAMPSQALSEAPTQVPSETSSMITPPLVREKSGVSFIVPSRALLMVSSLASMIVIW